MNKQAFFVGIKGVGMTSLALALQDAGWQVTGADTEESFITDDILASRGIKIFTPITAAIPANSDLVVYSGAYDQPDTSVKSLSLAEALSEFVKDRRVIAVAGVGGKTTTSAMLAALFHAAGRDVGYYVGTGSIAGLPSPGHAGKDPLYVVEADEYAVSKSDKRPKFALLTPEIVVTTNIIHDHPDVYPTSESTLEAFTGLINSLKPNGTWVYNPSDSLTRQILAVLERPLRDKNVQLVNYSENRSNYQLQVFGGQNQLDAHGAVSAAVAAGLSQEEAVSAIYHYGGAGRRQELHGEIAGRLLYDDYGHHPEEIAVTLKAFKEHFPKRRLLLVFESHTYTRTEALLPEFAKALAQADLPFIMPIFESAREKGQIHHVTPDSFANLVKSINPNAVALTWENAANTVWAASREGDLILTMGAGFVYKLHTEFKQLTQ